MRQERFTRIRLLVTYLTRCLRAFSHIAQDLGLLTDAPCGGLDSPPARRARRVGSSITGTAGLMVVTFYIPITPLSGHTSLRWFGTSPCRAIPEGRFLHLWCSIAQVEFNLLHRPLLHVRGTQGSLAFRNASSSRDRWRVGQCKRRQRARPKDAFECSGSQAVNSEPEHSNIKFLTTRRALPRRAPRTHARTP